MYFLVQIENFHLAVPIFARNLNFPVNRHSYIHYKVSRLQSLVQQPSEKLCHLCFYCIAQLRAAPVQIIIANSHYTLHLHHHQHNICKGVREMGTRCQEKARQLCTYSMFRIHIFNYKKSKQPRDFY